MGEDMPCSTRQVQHYNNPQRDVKPFISKLLAGKWFGFAEVDIRVPPHLRDKFPEMCPLFLNRAVDYVDVTQDMLDYPQRTGRKRVQTKMQLGTMSVSHILLYAPMLRWYIEHCLEVTTVYRTIKDNARKILQ